VVKQGREELLKVIDEALASIRAEPEPAPAEAAVPPDDSAVPDQKMSVRAARKKRPDLARPW
jgi:hypothetical protein